MEENLLYLFRFSNYATMVFIIVGIGRLVKSAPGRAADRQEILDDGEMDGIE